MFVSPFSEKPSSSGRVGVKQVGHEAGRGQAFQRAGPCLPASFQLQLPPAAGLLVLRPPSPTVMPFREKEKRGVSFQGAPEF